MARDYRVRAMDPGVRILSKLASIVLHIDEGFGETGHAFDITAVKALVNEPDVREWIAAMDKLALVPKRRTDPTSGESR